MVFYIWGSFEIVDGKETGKLKTDGTFRKYEMTNGRTFDIPGYGPVVVPDGVGTTDVGNVIDPSELIPTK